MNTRFLIQHSKAVKKNMLFLESPSCRRNELFCLDQKDPKSVVSAEDRAFLHSHNMRIHAHLWKNILHWINMHIERDVHNVWGCVTSKPVNLIFVADHGSHK